jgi:hypothetical protein
MMTAINSPLRQLEERLEANGLGADALRVATVILGIARINGWTENPERMSEWVERLALEVIKESSSPH